MLLIQKHDYDFISSLLIICVHYCTSIAPITTFISTTCKFVILQPIQIGTSQKLF